MANKMNLETKEMIYKAYKHGGNFKEIARTYNVSYPRLVRILKEIGGKDFVIDKRDR